MAKGSARDDLHKRKGTGPHRPPKPDQARKRKPKDKSAPKAEPLGPSAEDVNETLFPVGSTVTLSSGKKVTVKPWTIHMFGEMSQRIPQTMEAGLGASDDAAVPVVQILTNAMDEVVYMVARTLDWSEDQVHADMNIDDLLLVATSIWDNCIMGPMGKIAGLAGRIFGAMGAADSPVQVKTQTPPGS